MDLGISPWPCRDKPVTPAHPRFLHSIVTPAHLSRRLLCTTPYRHPRPPSVKHPPHHRRAGRGGGGGGGEYPGYPPPVTKPPAVFPTIITNPLGVRPPIVNPPRILPPITTPPGKWWRKGRRSHPTPYNSKDVPYGACPNSPRAREPCGEC
ncbi:hypothetical protein SAY87_020545 [Trapa incisa]|uniref:Uncharacterized protein n=1 Tax=Trapa incisa TaxID=236973 RepID=A0AAN7JRH5_9MYRT|nr:hypothetical protein SAY87_020545 [Trapa incisa]